MMNAFDVPSFYDEIIVSFRTRRVSRSDERSSVEHRTEAYAD